MLDNSTKVRIEEDLLGELEIPATAYYGIHSLRAYETSISRR